jgi:hypothetical protein
MDFGMVLTAAVKPRFDIAKKIISFQHNHRPRRLIKMVLVRVIEFVNAIDGGEFRVVFFVVIVEVVNVFEVWVLERNLALHF